MSACHCCEQPDGADIVFESSNKSVVAGDGLHATDVDAAEAVCEGESWPAFSAVAAVAEFLVVNNDDGDPCFVGIAKTKYRLSFRPTATCYLKIWLKVTTQDYDAEGALGAPSVSHLTYEWIGSGNPCIPAPSHGVAHAANRITSGDTLLPDPESLHSPSQARKTIELGKYSFLPGYTPPDDGSANGFPP